MYHIKFEAFASIHNMIFENNEPIRTYLERWILWDRETASAKID